MTATEQINEAAADPEKRVVWAILVGCVAFLVFVAVKFR